MRFILMSKKRICSWDDVNAIYRRDTLLNIPFRDVSFAEDALWAGDVLKQGYAIVYNPAAKVSHYHFETPAYTFRRCFTIYYHFYKFFQSRPVPPGNELLNILRNAKLLAFETKISWKNKWKWLLFNFHQRQAVREAIRVFDQTLSAGETFLDEKHREISATPPQASKPGFELATQPLT